MSVYFLKEGSDVILGSGGSGVEAGVGSDVGSGVEVCDELFVTVKCFWM